MRRLIALVLLLLLPLQTIWAASEPYCQHEQDQGSFHVGHHVHQDHADASGHDTEGKKVSNTSPMVDHDHHCCSSLSMLPSAVQLPNFACHAASAAAPLQTYGHVVSPRIERPNWPTSL